MVSCIGNVNVAKPSISIFFFFFFSSRRRHTRYWRDWSSDVCSSDLGSSQGPIQVEVSPKVSANDGQVLLAGARAGNGIALLSEYVALPSLRRGELVSMLEDFPVPEIWLKALVPDSRFSVSRVRALIE